MPGECISSQVHFFPHWRTTSESQIGVSVLLKATLVIVWSVVMRFNTLIRHICSKLFFFDNCFVACLFLWLLLLLPDHGCTIDQSWVIFHCLPLKKSNYSMNIVTSQCPFQQKRHNWHTLVIVLHLILVLALT